MKVVAIIQARMGSTRLPGKVLMHLATKPVLWHIVERVWRAELVDEVIIATTMNIEDDPIHLLRSEMKAYGVNVGIFRGDPEDVMDRMINCVEAARLSNADLIVEITGDCPMVSPKHMDFLIARMLETRNTKSGALDLAYDYATNCKVRTWPDGLDLIVYTKEALEEINRRRATDPTLRHHVGWNMFSQPDFCGFNWMAPERYHWPELGLVLDEPADLVFLNHLFTMFYSPEEPFSPEEVIAWLRENPEERVWNKEVRRKTPEEG